MGAGFVILIHLVIIFIVCIIIALVAGVLTYFICKQNRRRKVGFAIITPFIGLYTLYICGIIGSCIVSEKMNVDVGIGDCWYVPLENNSRLVFIDTSEQSFIEKDNQTIISFISLLEESGDLVLGKTDKEKYFSYNTKTNELKEFNTKNEFVASGHKIKLIDTYDFYLAKRNDIAGNWFIVVGVFSLIISIAVIYLLKLILAI